MGETVRVGEHTFVDLRHGLLTESDLTRLEQLREKGLLGLTPSTSGYRLSARNAVGVVALDRVRLVLEPKLPVSGRELIDWLRYATGSGSVDESAARRWRTGRSGFADLVISALVDECRRLTAEGLRCDYVERRTVEAALRGRLDVVAQATRRYGVVDRLHVHTHERSTDIWENQVCAAALSAALRLSDDPALTRVVVDCAQVFPRPIHRAKALAHLKQKRYTRLNERYRSAHVWAGLLLGGGGVRDLLADGEYGAGTLLLSMPALWEAIVVRLCRQATEKSFAPGALQVGGLRVTGDTFAHRPFRPDALITANEVTVAVDAKYKDYAGKGVSAPDVHQLLTYCAWYTPKNPRAVLMYPSRQGTVARELRVGDRSRALGTIDVVGVDVNAPPEAAIPLIEAVLTPLLMNPQ